MKSIINKSILILITLLFVSCSKTPEIILIGEAHHIKRIQDKELELYRDFYEKGGRHFFIEHGYSWASYMNMIMKSDKSFKSMLGDDPDLDLDFYQTIKDNFPETIFHGIDAELSTIGEQWLQLLKDNDLGTEDEYNTILEVIEQGKTVHSHYGYNKDVYREEYLTKNFIRESGKERNTLQRNKTGY